MKRRLLLCLCFYVRELRRGEKEGEGRTVEAELSLWDVEFAAPAIGVSWAVECGCCHQRDNREQWD
jgi:hypothetical protein